MNAEHMKKQTRAAVAAGVRAGLKADQIERMINAFGLDSATNIFLHWQGGVKSAGGNLSTATRSALAARIPARKVAELLAVFGDDEAILARIADGKRAAKADDRWARLGLPASKEARLATASEHYDSFWRRQTKTAAMPNVADMIPALADTLEVDAALLELLRRKLGDEELFGILRDAVGASNITYDMHVVTGA